MTGSREERARLRALERHSSQAAALVRRVAGDKRAVELRDLLEEYTEIGADLLAAALALRTLVTFLVALLLVVVTVGVLSDDPALRRAVVERAASLVPGLDRPVTTMLRDVSTGRATYSVIGLLGLAWTMGGIYGALDDALHRAFPGGRPRGTVERRVRGLAAVVLLVLVVGGALVLGGAWTYVEADLGLAQARLAWRLLSPIVSIILATGIVLALFRIVPTSPPTIGQAFTPALAAGALIALMTTAYALIVPRLIGSLNVFGAVAVVIGALLWLGWVFRVLLLAAVWASRRRGTAALAPPRAGVGAP